MTNFEQEIEKEAVEKLKELKESNSKWVIYKAEVVETFIAGAIKARELTLKELGVSDPKEVMSRFLHEQRCKELVEVLELLRSYPNDFRAQLKADEALKNLKGGE